ncbi:hypothetical protein CXF68_17800 [Tenacibaculum sp. Bg11-29]|uniref:hypothetical protein n=1 Tax=Tenacibaculum sp. Bg11-29 TaxID=2058306 RepID=UPI000C325B46|nr:hypothetical protein [Tenacibaculum sp. Bg11-29]PKH52432.1 hypothetical protein CXF68_17800 [Tenacibaculum sp. Bg11-29]
MKKIKFLLILLILSSCSNLRYLDAFDGFKNSPKEIKLTTFRVKYIDSMPHEEISTIDIYYYDTKGRKIKNLEFDSNGLPIFGGANYSYDRYGNQIQYIFYNNDGTIDVQYNYKYNKFGQLIEKEHISESEKSITKYEIDRENKLRKMISRNNDGSISEKSLLKYDEKWRDSVLIFYDLSGKMKSKIETSYDKNGNEILSKWFNSENKPYEISEKKYDLNNNRTQVKKFQILSGEKKLISYTEFEYKYDQYGNSIEQKLIFDGKTSWIIRGEFKYVW